MKTTKTNLKTIISEAIKNALSSTEYDEMGAAREKPEEKKARLDGKKQAIQKLSDKSVEELKRVYLELEAKSERVYQEPLKYAFIWGALDQIKAMLKKAGHGLPKKSQDPWTR